MVTRQELASISGGKRINEEADSVLDGLQELANTVNSFEYCNRSELETALRHFVNASRALRRAFLVDELDTPLSPDQSDNVYEARAAINEELLGMHKKHKTESSGSDETPET